MVEFTVKEVAKNIDTTTQYVYQQMQSLIEEGLAYRNEKGKPMIYDKGLEFLKSKRLTGLQVANKGLQNNNENNSQGVEKITKIDFATNENFEKIVEIYKELYEEQKKEKEYWQQQYFEKDKALTEITSSLLLPSGKEEQKPKRKKWNFWNKKTEKSD